MAAAHSGVNHKASLLSWSPDDRYILACFGDKPPMLINPVTKHAIKELSVETRDRPRSPVGQDDDELSTGYLAAWSPYGDEVAIGKDNVVQIININNGRVRTNHAVRMNPLSAAEILAALNQDPVLSRLPAIGSKEEQLQRLEKYLKTVSNTITTLRWDQAGIAIGTQCGSYQLDLDNNAKKMLLRPHACPGAVRSPVLSPDGRFLAGLFVPDADVIGDLYWNFNRALNVARRVLRIWRPDTGVVEVQYYGDDLPDFRLCRLFWSADGQKLAWGYDNKVIIFGLDSQVGRVLIRSQDDHIDYLAWHPIYNHLAVQDYSLGIVVYDTVTGVKRASYRDALWGKPKDMSDRVFAWSNSGDAIVVGNNNSIDVWKVNANTNVRA